MLLPLLALMAVIYLSIDVALFDPSDQSSYLSVYPNLSFDGPQNGTSTHHSTLDGATSSWTTQVAEYLGDDWLEVPSLDDENAEDSIHDMEGLEDEVIHKSALNDSLVPTVRLIIYVTGTVQNISTEIPHFDFDALYYLETRFLDAFMYPSILRQAKTGISPLFAPTVQGRIGLTQIHGLVLVSDSCLLQIFD